MSHYMIDDEIVVSTPAPNQMDNASDVIDEALSKMLQICNSINLGEEIISDINTLREQYDELSAEVMINKVHKFDARLFFKVMDFISIMINEQSRTMRNILYSEFFYNNTSGVDAPAEDTNAAEPAFDALFEGYEEDKPKDEVYDYRELNESANVDVED